MDGLRGGEDVLIGGDVGVDNERGGAAPLPPPPGDPMGDGGGEQDGVIAAANGPDPGVPPDPGPDPNDQDDDDDDQGDDDSSVDTDTSLDSDGTFDDFYDLHCGDWYGFREAVELLEDRNDPSPISCLALEASRGGEVGLARERNRARSFRRFVAALREGRRAVRAIDLCMNDWSGLPDDDVEDFFGKVLPSHPTLRHIYVHIRFLPAKILRMLTESFPTAKETSIVRLYIYGEVIDSEHIEAIADMLERNATIEILVVDSEVDADQCKLICQALARNTYLRALELRVREAFKLDGLATSCLEQLYVHGSFSEDLVPTFAKQLRTNETLWDLNVCRSGPLHVAPASRALLDLVKNYNCTLRKLGAFVGSERKRWRAYKRRNRWIQDALEHLQHPFRGDAVTASTRMRNHPTRHAPDEEQLPQPSRQGAMSVQVLPRALGPMSDVPTALYRIMKMGYVHMVGDRLALPATMRRLVLRDLCDYKSDDKDGALTAAAPSPNASSRSKEDRVADALEDLANLFWAEETKGFPAARTAADECDAAIRVLTILQWNAHHVRLLEHGFFFLATWMHQNPEGTDKVRRQGLPDLVVDAMKRFPDVETLQRRALEALDNLYVCAAGADKTQLVQKLHGVELVASTMARYPDNYHVQARSIRLLTWICQVPDLRGDVVPAKAVILVVKAAAEVHMDHGEEDVTSIDESGAPPSPPFECEMHRYAEELTNQLLPLVWSRRRGSTTTGRGEPVDRSHV